MLMLILINCLIMVTPQDILQDISTLDIGITNSDCSKFKNMVERLNYVEKVLNGLKSECKEEYYAFSQSILEESYTWNKNGICTKKLYESHFKRLRYLEDLRSAIVEHCRKYTSHTQLSTHPESASSAVTETMDPETTKEHASWPLTYSTVTTRDTTYDLSPKDCFDIYNRNISANGVYRIFPNGMEFDVYCDMDDGGWTVIQMRLNDTVNFTRGWNDYVSGFGDLKQGNFWLGLEYIHILTTPPVDVMIEGITRNTGERAWMWYNNFTVDGSETSYTMHVDVNGTYSDVAARRNFDRYNGFGYHNGMPFATYDNLDGSGCSKSYEGGGWWYKTCWAVLVNNPFDKMNLLSSFKNGNVISSKIKIRRN